jgi:glycosyltransferase involved in cell wall biosynthesis
LESVAGQGLAVKRHIVIDGGSTDMSTDTLRKAALVNPGLVWRSESDRGQSDALNKALALVDTEYFGWLNADDLYEDGGIALLLEGTAGLPAVVYGDYRVIDEHGKILRHRCQPSFSRWDCLYGYLTVQNCAALFRTDAVRAVGGFDVSLRFAMDYDLILRLATSGGVVHVHGYAGSFRIHGTSKTSSLTDVCVQETWQIRRKYSGRSDAALRWRWWMASFHVLLRMLWEGCLGCRLTARR